MAEGFARSIAAPDIVVASAGTEASNVHPLAVQVMQEAGIDIASHQSKALDSLGSTHFDIVITLCHEAGAQCPILPGHPQVVKWNLPDPAAASGAEKDILSAFRSSRDQIQRLVQDLFERGYVAALAESKCNADTILNSISDGIIAHDMDRHIFYFNRAAEQITGFTADEVMNRDCHDVFPGNFCGGNCEFCDDNVPSHAVSEREQKIATKSGETRLVQMSIRMMETPSHENAGVLASFRDITRERRLSRKLGEMNQFSGIIGHDHKMLDVFDLIRDLADSNAPVLIQGESGTGKELVASAIHNEGQRAAKLFVPVNCGALPEALLESELFGHVKGAFTGAIRDKKGRFELADGGTIFLDEIGDISQAMQVRLLRVLQEGHFERVGGEETIKVDVRVISATNKDLSHEINDGRFREDLFYRLSVVPLDLPPLRDRRNDIPILADHTLERLKKETGRPDITIAPEALGIMLSYSWPGNVRELQNWLQFALIKCKQDIILPQHLPPPRSGPDQRGNIGLTRKRRKKLDIESVSAAFDETNGNKLEAAKLLNVSRATLYRFLDDTEL